MPPIYTYYRGSYFLSNMYSFYVSYKQKKVFVSDYPMEKARRHFGHDIELVNSIKDKEHLELIKSRVLRSFNGFEVVEQMEKPKYVMTPEHKQALINSKLGKKRPDDVRRKISLSKKGKSNFEGKKHTYETKRLMAARKIGNTHNKEYIWAHDPNSSAEVMVKDLNSIPKGFSKGRDYYSTEPGLYVMNSKTKT